MKLLPNQIESSLTDQQLRQLSAKGFLRVEGIGMYRKNNAGITFEAFEFDGIVDDSGVIGSVKAKEEVPAWLVERGKTNHKTDHSTLATEISNRNLPQGLTQAKVINDRKERHIQRKKVQMKSKSRSRDLSILGITALLALILLLLPFWLVDSDDRSISDVLAGNSNTGTSLVAGQVENSSNGDAEAVGIDSAGEKVLEEPRPKDAAYSTASERERKAAEKDIPIKTPATKTTDAKVEVKSTGNVSLIKSKLGDAVGGQFAIVVASMKSIESAKKMAEEFKGKGISPEIVSSPVKGQTYYRVLLGRYNKRSEAESSQKSLGGDFWITRLANGSKLLATS